jgi:hypothetical protein
MRVTQLSILLGASALVSVAFAQTAPLGAASDPPPAQPPTAGNAAPTSGSANICTELLAFLTPKPRAPDATVSEPAQSAQPATQPAASAGAQASTSPATMPETQGGSAQEISRQAAAAIEAPKQNAAPASNEDSGQSAPQKSGISAPVPNAPQVIKKSPTMSLQEGQALAAANDIQGCKDAAQSMRRDGVDLPPVLIALAALDMQFQQKAAPGSH